MSIHTTHTRDAALRQLGRTNRVLIAAAVGLTGVLSDVAANAFPGKTIKSAAAGKQGTAKAHGASTTTSTQPLSPPAQAPQATTSTEATAPAESSQQATPSQESTPPAESSQQATPSQESTPPAESSQQATPSQESTPSQEAAPPVVSGGS
jgi:hypothetical protein